MSMRAVVVGASSGLGRCIAHRSRPARREGGGAGAAPRSGEGRPRPRSAPARSRSRATRPIAASCRDAIEEAAAGLGGIDALVYSPGVGPLARLADLDAATWRAAFDTNVIGAALVTAAALPHLAASKGAAAYLSTVSASLTPPWPGLGAYAVTKAALDKLVEAWRSEHPNVGFTRVVVGDCAGGQGNSMTEFAARLGRQARRRDDPALERSATC